MLEGLYLKIGGEQVPNQPYSSTGARFLQEQLIINDLDGNLQGTSEFTNSIINERNAPNGTRYLNALSDDTAFIATFQTERGDSAYVFDGLDSRGENITVLLKGESKYKGVNNTYFYPLVDATGQTILTPNPCFPQYWGCADKWWHVAPGSVEWHDRDYPPGSQINE
jgi:hypothetical protein